MRIKISLLFFLLFLNLYTITGQLSYGGRPVDFDAGIYPEVLPPVPAAKKAEIIKESKRVLPFKFAYSFNVNYSCDKDGEWFALPDGGRLWRLKIRSEGARSLNVIFKRFRLPEGGKVFIYDPDRNTVLGAFTSRNNKPSKIFAVAPVPGDEMIIEYSDDGNVEFEPELETASVNHDFLGVFGYITGETKSGWFGDSGSCNVNVNCSDFTPDTVQRAVCKIIVDGSMLCTGTLMNNTRKDGTPYFLTAAHCLTSGNSDKSIVFYFNYETPECISFMEGSKDQTLSGSTLKAKVDTLDFALVEIDNMPPATYRPYWSGWNRSTTPPPPFVAIHHPQGDVKKVALEEDAITAVSFDAEDVHGNPFVKDAHWLVQTWEKGTTEGGSSGAGIFDSGARLVGTLSGGEAYCGHSVNDYFARLNKMWDYLSGDTVQVAVWLDPDNSGIVRLGGYDHYNKRSGRLSHLIKSDTVVILKDEGMTGYWSGHNSLGVTEYAEFYSDISSATVNGIYLMLGVRPYGADDTVKVRLWSGNYGSPQTLLAEKAVSLSSVQKNREYLINFDQPVNVSGSFFAGVNISYSGTETDTIALYQIRKHTGDLSEYGFLNDGGEWKRLSELHPDGVRSNYWIDVLASDVTYTGIKDKKAETDTGVEVYPVPVRNRLYFRIMSGVLQKVNIYNISGSLLQSSIFNPGITTGDVDVSGLPPGVCLVQFVFHNRTITRKIVIGK